MLDIIEDEEIGTGTTIITSDGQPHQMGSVGQPEHLMIPESTRVPLGLQDPEVLQFIRGAVNLATTSSDRAYDAWEHIMGDAEAKVKSWIFWGEEPKGDRDPPGGWIGIKDATKNVHGWYPQQIRKSLDAGGYNPEATLRAWKDLGVITRCEKTRFTGQFRPHGSRRKVRLVLVSTTYPGHETDDDDDD